jgi:MFS family permease
MRRAPGKVWRAAAAPTATITSDRLPEVFICGWLGARVGVLGAVIGTEAGTAALILAVLVSPVAACLALLPLLGIVLNGTSSVLYGTVPELTSAERTERAFALIYTGTIGSGAVLSVSLDLRPIAALVDTLFGLGNTLFGRIDSLLR